MEMYIRFLISDQQVYLRSDVNIDSFENGMLLRHDLHDRFGRGESALLKTPNPALDPADIPRVEVGETPASRTTIQHIEPCMGWDLVQQWDVRVGWVVQDAPLSIPLDYMYGVAVVQLWVTADIQNLLKDRHETYSNIPCLRGLYTAVESIRCAWIQNNVRVMDTAFAFSMFFRGYSRGTTFARILQKQEEETEMRSGFVDSLSHAPRESWNIHKYR